MRRCVAAAVLLCASVQACAQAIIRVDGSSTVFPITQAAADEFRRTRAGVQVAIGVSGTSGGLRKFCRGEIDLANASRPILAGEREACVGADVAFLELPVAFDAITVVVNPKNGFVRELSVEDLRRLWEPAAEGVLTRWKQLNPAWPDRPLRLYSPGRDSGTFDYFTEAVVGKSRSARRDVTASEDDEVLAQGVARDVNALGYFGYAYYSEHRERLRAVPVAGGGRPAVAPSPASVASGGYRPLSRTLLIYVSLRSLARDEVRQFVEHYMENAARFASAAKSMPLSEDAYAAGRELMRRSYSRR
jgi:phosphate transport system substrate-binding protein